VKELKRVSNNWLKQQDGGYANFSVSRSNLPHVEKYIASQEHHHRRMTFQDELRALLRRHQIEFDERYVWD
jgi:putative transposase